MLQLHLSKRRPLIEDLSRLNKYVIGLVVLITSVGLLTLYSAAGGHLQPWASAQFFRFLVGFSLMLIVGLTSLRLWFRYAYVFYGISMTLIGLVSLVGHIGKGGQRWLNLYFFHLQPSELMKIALALALARFFHTYEAERGPLWNIGLPFALIMVPTLLVAKQPDLGTAVLFAGVGLGLCFVAGLPRQLFITGGALLLGSLPLLWPFLHDYQKKRVFMFLDPESDRLGSGYHIIQSKIALGSGGVLGKGFLAGTQSHLNFLPEKQTDFVFTMFSEEFGLLGALCLLLLYGLLLGAGTVIALRSGSTFGRLLSYSVVLTLFIYMFINMAMVMGVVPVVGVPLPLVSYGGTSMLTLLFGFGLLLAADRERDQTLWTV